MKMMKMLYDAGLVQWNSSLRSCVCDAFSRSTEKPLRVYARSDGGASAGRVFGVEGGGRRGCARGAPAPGLQLPPVVSRLCIDESRPRVGTAWYASRFRSRGCVTCRASWTRREVEQCLRASWSCRFAFVATTRAGPTDGDDVSGIRDVLKRRQGDEQPRFNVLFCLWDECRGEKLMESSD